MALHLSRITRRQVVCTLYESDQGDRGIGRHVDAWDGVIMQMRGVKAWTIWPPAADRREIHMRPGDVLLLPAYVPHAVATPDTSVHLVFALTEPLTGSVL
ncbi:JmjC domain-containing protein [Streptomyces sp. 8L]|uniref:JmjC domain-containing protein n=1 Tax=Streptomyces sp. 8L TaxID=2877242 RepID=UPI001CD564C6|nr:cupin domain-containing protein [Streptomyces sp. 8L]MCA1220041.1 hypothetical protein [Streptomyces sp. 8L]